MKKGSRISFGNSRSQLLLESHSKLVEKSNELEDGDLSFGKLDEESLSKDMQNSDSDFGLNKQSNDQSSQDQ